MRVAVAFDHRGVKLRERVLEELASLGHGCDLGTDTVGANRLPRQARQVGLAIRG
jgi:ribose 5-phosphate isomerase RpiB